MEAMNRRTAALLPLALAAALAAAACATESHRTLERESAAPAGPSGAAWSGPRVSIGVGAFENRTAYMNGLFSDGTDRLGNRARTVLKTRLAETGRFVVVDHENLGVYREEAKLAGEGPRITAAGLVVAGEVTEFGRRETGDQILFGILGRGMSQVAYARVSLHIVDPLTSEVLRVVQGAGEYALESREIIGTGGTSRHDPTLNGKVLDLAILDAVRNLVADLEAGK